MGASGEAAFAAVKRRACRARYQDGIDELRDGASGPLVALGSAAPAGYRLAARSAVGLAIFGLHLGLILAKRRLTDPRTGFERPAAGSGHPTRLSWWLADRVALLGALFAAVEDVAKRSRPLPSLGELWSCILLLAGVLWRARSAGLVHYYVLAAMPVVAAVVAWPVGDDLWANIALLVTGGFALHRCLREHPVPNPA